MTKKCDHKSVGMLVWRGDNLLLIERRKPPFGFAPPAGHVDGESYEDAAERELKEEVGLTVENIRLLIEGRKENPCRREDGNWHDWKVYEVKASGTLNRSEGETKQANFYTKDDLLGLATRTEEYLHGGIRQEDWEKSPGLEPVWYEWLKELRIMQL